MSVFIRSGCCPKSSQAGFSLVEVAVVTAIILMLAVISVPAIGGYIIENKVPKVGEELSRFILQMRVQATDGSTNPYANIQARHLADQVAGASVFSVSGQAQAPTIRHGLGASGEVQVQAVSGGAGFSLTLSNVNHAACPALVSVMQHVADSVSQGVQGGGQVVIKSDTVAYSALETKTRCEKGDRNTFVFTAS